MTSGSFEFSGLIQTAVPSGNYINPFRLFAHSVEGLHVPQVQANGTILKLKGGASGVQVLDSSNGLLLEVSTVAVSALQNFAVINGSSNASIGTTNTSGSGFASNYMTAAGVSSQLFVGGSQFFIGTNSNHPVRFASNRFSNATQMTLETNGTVVVNGSVVNSSDSRLKDNQTPAPLAEMVAIFDAVEPKFYDRNDLEGQRRCGFIAQELETVCLGNFAHIVGEGTRSSTTTAAIDGEPNRLRRPSKPWITVVWSRCSGASVKISRRESNFWKPT